MTGLQIYTGGMAITALVFMWAAMIATPEDVRKMTLRGALWAIVCWPLTWGWLAVLTTRRARS